MKQRTRRPGESRFLGWLYLLPALIVYLLFVLYPVLETFRTSFFRWDGFSANRVFIGLENYVSLVNDRLFLLALSHNLVFIFFYAILPIIIGLLLASIMGRQKLRGLTIYRAGLFLPQVISMVVVGVVWRWIYNPAFGPLNRFLKSVGLDSLAKPWLGDFDVALPAVGIIGTWVMYGFCMVLFLAGVQRIDKELYEVAELDGANGWQQLRYITLPSLRPEIIVAFITTLIAALRVFDLVFVTTKGGPGETTLVVAFLVYRAAFELNRIGYAAAAATVLTILILTISAVVMRFQPERTS